MPKTKTPGTVLQSILDEYQMTAFFLSKEIKVNYQILQHILKGKARITIPTAMKLGKFFGQSPINWIDLQLAVDVEELSKDKKFVSELKKIQKAVKPSGKAKKQAQPKAGKRKTKTLAEKRKKSAKKPGAKPARGKRVYKRR